MRMRTCNSYLVQIAALLIAIGVHASALSAEGDYGADVENRSYSDATTNTVETQGTVIKMPADNERSERAMPRSSSEPSPAPAVDTPTRGMTMDRVLARYGAPVKRHAAVGQPPITRWDYPHYRLYFEYNHVLHAVQSQAPEPLAHTRKLSTARP